MVSRIPYAVAGVSLLAAFGAAPALGASVSYFLDQSNISSLPSGTNYLEVDIASTTAGTASFTVTPVYAFTHLSNFGIQEFGFNYSGSNTITASNFTVLPSSWTVDPPPPSGMDGFGKYDFIVGDGGGTRQSPLSFTVTGLGGATPTETLGYFAKPSSGGGTPEFFAVHLADFQGGAGSDNSAFFAGQTLGGGTPLPETETWAMMLAGLGLVGLQLRRRNAGQHLIHA